MKTLPSRAYSVTSPIFQATVVRSLCLRERDGSVPTFMSMKQPVP